ncbi:hypothetical protein DPMN_077737 [Dreissena polymorpha]|uniref:Uncharacterized protein n=1 Tax=Dreissena polymorpha TaxID=45954 RepID=A0A9D3YMI7_DREPO|nr:hypothetical protein DPMN_077737 [Dreissena polymorpha]
MDLIQLCWFQSNLCAEVDGCNCKADVRDLGTAEGTHPEPRRLLGRLCPRRDHMAAFDIY